MDMKKRIIFATLIGCLTFLPGTYAQELVDVILALVNDSPITLQELQKFTKEDELFLADKFRDQPEKLRKEIVRMRENSLDILVNRDVILADSKESIKVPEAIIDEVVSERIKDHWKDRVELDKRLRLEGMTMEQLKKQERDRLIVEQMRLKNIPEAIISPLKVVTYYKAHQDDFKVEDEVKLRMIFLSKEPKDKVEATRRRAAEILSQINTGASFEEMAKTYSEGSLRDQGGETGWEEISIVDKAIGAELTKLKVGEHSGVVDTEQGYYILLLEDRHPAHVKPLKDVRAQIETILSSKETDRLQKEWIGRLKKKTFVNML